MKAYRVEDQINKHGIWRNFDGSWNPVFDKLTNGLVKDMPMGDSTFYRDFNKQWFSATDTKEKLRHWFSAIDIYEMEQLGYEVLEFEITDYRNVSDYEIAFTRDTIVCQRVIHPEEIWENEYLDLQLIIQPKANLM